jgi:hypothetical protein
VLSVIIGLILLGGPLSWMFYVLRQYPPHAHIVAFTLLPPILCGFYIGLLFRQRAAKIVSIVFTVLLSLLYPFFSFVILFGEGSSSVTYTAICCIFIGNLLFVVIIRLLNDRFLRSPKKTDEKEVFHSAWHRFKEGKFFFATWTHFTILRLMPLITAIFIEEWPAFFNVLTIYVLSYGISVFYYFYWQRTREELTYYQSPEEESIKP